MPPHSRYDFLSLCPSDDEQEVEDLIKESESYENLSVGTFAQRERTREVFEVYAAVKHGIDPPEAVWGHTDIDSLSSFHVNACMRAELLLQA